MSRSRSALFAVVLSASALLVPVAGEAITIVECSAQIVGGAASCQTTFVYDGSPFYYHLTTHAAHGLVRGGVGTLEWFDSDGTLVFTLTCRPTYWPPEVTPRAWCSRAVTDDRVSGTQTLRVTATGLAGLCDLTCTFHGRLATSIDT